MKSRFKTLLCMLISIVMVLSLIITAFADSTAASPTTQEANSVENPVYNSDTLESGNSKQLNLPTENETVSVVIRLKDSPIIEQKEKDPTLPSVQNAMKTLEKKQSAFALSAEKNGIEMEVLHNYTVIMNGMGVTMRYGDLEKLRAMDEVENAWVATRYTIPEDKPNMAAANKMTGVSYLHDLDNKGAGMVIAVLDTGINLDHPAFKGYGETVNPAISKGLAVHYIYQYFLGLGEYYSEKIPFIYNFGGGSTLNVTDTNGHGTHVASILVGYEVRDTAGTSVFSGVAPAAQLLPLKIFPNGSDYTDSTIYLDALDAAYIFGADVINMSIGSPAGFSMDIETENQELADVYKKIEDAGIILCIAAGNDYSSAKNNINSYDFPVTDYTDYGIVSSPSTYHGSISVASADNIWHDLNTIKAGGELYGYIDNSTDPNKAFINLAGEHEYIATADVFSIHPTLSKIAGKIGLIDLETYPKKSLKSTVKTFQNAGAIGMIVYSTGDLPALDIHLNDYDIPIVTVSEDTGYDLRDAANLDGTDLIGTLIVNNPPDNSNNISTWRMSDFSSWGCTPDLKLKPQISAPGNDIYSADPKSRDLYTSKSGTSMAAPNVAGSMALIMERLKANYPSKPVRAELAEDLIFSTAFILKDDNGRVYSPRKQGTGLIQTFSAAKAEAYIENPIIEFGHDPDKTGVYELEYTVNNLSNEDITYNVDTIALCDGFWTDITGKTYNTLSSEAMIDNGWAEFSVSNSVDNNITVPANGSTSFTVTLTLTDEGKSVLENFKNGTFVEGYVTLTSNEEDVEPIHGTFMGFYGDWTAAPMIEDNESPINSGRNIVGSIYVTTRYGNALVADLNANLFDETVIAPDYCCAIRNPVSYGEPYSKDAVCIVPMLLRNAKAITMRVKDATTGEIYSEHTDEYIPKATYDDSSDSFLPTIELLWGGDDNDGNLLPDNTLVIVDVYGTLDFEGAEEQLLISTPVILIDDEEPNIEATWSSADPEKMSFNLSDDHYLMYSDIYFYDVENKPVSYMDKAFSNGESNYTCEIDSTNISSSADTIYAKVYDYAGNLYNYNIGLGDKFPVDVTASEGGSVSLNMNKERIIAEIKPDDGCSIADVIVDGVSQGALDSYTFDDLTAIHTINVSFTSNGSSVSREDDDGIDLTPGAYYAADYSGTYDGKAHGITVKAGSDAKSIKYGTSDGSYNLTSAPTYKNAGSYTVYYQIEYNNYTTITGSKTVSIAKKSLSNAEVTLGNSISYNGNIQTQTVASVTIDGMTVPASDYTITGNTGINVGNYTLTVTAKDTSVNFAGIVTKSWSIARGDGDGREDNDGIDLAPGAYYAADYSGTYDGKAHGITVKAGSDAKSVKYGTSAGSYNLTSAPTYKNAGTYTVYYQIEYNNYTTITGSKAVSIAKKSLSNADITLGNALTYNGNVQAQTVASVTIDGMTVPASDYTITGNTGINVGNYTLTVTAKDTSVNFAGIVTMPWSIAKGEDVITAVAINDVTFPDAAFRRYVNRFDTDKDGYLSAEETAAVTRISLNGQGIVSVKGIEYFTELKELFCENNQITELDMRQNTKLIALFCQYNKLTSIDVTGLDSLEYITCQNNQLTELSISGNKSLMTLYCEKNNLTQLYISENPALETFRHDSNIILY